MADDLQTALQDKASAARRNSAAGRHLQNALLSWAVAARLEGMDERALLQSQDPLMSLSQGALSALNRIDCEARHTALSIFHDKWQDQSLVMEKWFSLMAMAPENGTIDVIQTLMTHPAFDPQNPNKLRSVLGSFVAANPVQFHAEDGAGYEFVAHQLIELDKRNPQIAARMALGLTRVSSYDEARQARMKAALVTLQAGATSRDLTEVVEKALSA